MPGSAAATAGDHVGAPHASSALGRYHVGLDGMRGVGMATVLAYHGGVKGVPGAYLALSQFFTLSGFLVTAMLLRAHDGGGIALRRFWVRRVRRLVPASLLALAGIAVFGVLVATPSQAETLPTHLAAAALWVANWYSILGDQSYVDMFAAPSPVDHFWSLSMEEQFYLGMSFGMVLLVRISSRTRTLVAVFGAIAVASLAWTIHLHRGGAPLDRVYLGTDTRLTEILLGSILAVLIVRGVLDPGRRAQVVLGWTAAVAYVGSLWLWHVVPLGSQRVWGSGGIGAYGLVTALVIAGILTGRGPLARVLSFWPFAALGRVSYGVYLYHWPVFLTLTSQRTGLDGNALLALRVAVTLGLATLSYHLVELPIRNGATLRLPRRARYVAMPACTAVLIAAAVVVVPSGGTDDTATFSGSGADDPPPAAADPVLDVLVIADADAGPVTEHLVARARRAEDVEVVDGGTFACDRLEDGPAGWRCPQWEDEWGALVDEHDPDAVLLFVEDWDAEDLRGLVDAAGGAGEALDQVAQEVLAGGFDVLSRRGAPITWAVGSVDLEDVEARARQPFHQAMGRLLRQRTDLRSSPWLPKRREQMGRPYLQRVADTLFEALATTRRRSGGEELRVLVVGDSTARSVGFGLEQHAAEHETSVVWNVAVGGCGIAQDGIARDFSDGRTHEPDEVCLEAIAGWPGNVADFDPDVVLVLSGVRDAQDRDLEGDGTFAAPGDPAFDEYLLGTYLEATDVLSAGGARVVWLSPPCVILLPGLRDVGEVDTEVFDPARMAAVRAVVDRIPEERPDAAMVYDLDAVLCPGGEFLESTDGVDAIRPDGIHLSVDGSRWLADHLHADLLAPLAESLGVGGPAAGEGEGEDEGEGEASEPG